MLYNISKLKFRRECQMFDNISDKMKSAATALAVLGIIGSIIVGIVMIAESPLVGLLVIVIGSLSSWVSSFTLYGFGQLIENTDIISAKLESIKRITSEYAANASDKTQASSNDTKGSINIGSRVCTCGLCAKDTVDVTACKIVDSTGTQYYYLCADCMKKYNAVPIKK